MKTISMRGKLLSLLLAISMVLAMMPAMVFAEGEAVAKIGDTEYATLKEAFVAATDGQTITLLKDCTETGLGVKDGKSVIINLNAKSLNGSGWAFNQYSNGVIKITGSGSIAKFRVGSSGKIIIEEGFTGTVDAITYAGGTLEIKGGTFSKNISITNGASYNPTTYTLSKFIATGYTTTDIGDNVKVVPITAETAVASAKIGNDTYYYMTLDEAFDKAKAGGTVTLLKDFQGALSNSANYYATGNVVFDLNGHAWDLKAGSTCNGTGIRLYSGNLTVKTSKEGGAIVPSWSGCRIFEIEGGTLTIENGNYYNADRGGKAITGANDGGCKGELTIKGGTFGVVSINSACPSVTISGGTFKKTITTQYNSATVVNISDGTFEGQINCNQSSTGVFNISGGTFKGYVGNGGTFNIVGGKFDTSNMLTNSNTSFAVSGGYYTDDPTKKSSVTLAGGYSVIANDGSKVSKTEYPYTIGHVVTLVYDNGKENSKVEVRHGECIEKPTNPTKDGNSFAGWYKADGTQFMFNNAITEDTTLTAHWLPNDKKGDVVVEQKKSSTIESKSDITNSVIPLTDGEINAIKDSSNTEVKAILDIEAVSKPQSETPVDDATLIQKVIKDEKLKYGIYIDITVMKATYKDGEKQAGTETEVHETLKPITITVVIPEDLREEGRTYSIIRCHEGETEILYSGKANSKWEISFDTDKFSTYAIAYTDTAKSGVDTGDHNNIVLYVGIGLLALLGLAVTLMMKKKGQR